MSGLAELLLPAVRWDPERGYEPARPTIDHALELGVGGFILFGGPQEEVRALTKQMRGRSRIPLLVGADLERGAGQQFDGATGLPPLAAIAWTGDEEVLRRAAKLTAREARTIGVNWDYAPVCDLDLVPENPIVGTRALGNDPKTVGRLASAWIESCQREGVLACAKHFPGHGRTTGDSHMMLPTVNVPRAEFWETDLAPFRAAVAAGVASVMTAHVAYPMLDPSGVPATLSRDILRLLLRDRLHFDGLVVTDALIMEGVLGSDGETGAAVRALDAGCDLLLYPADIDAVLRSLENALREGTLDEIRIQQSRRRRLKWAQWASPPTDYRRATGSDVAWAARVCERVVHVVHGPVPALGQRVEVVIVDDDVGGPYPALSREPFVAALRAAGLSPSVVPAPTSRGAGPLLVAVFGDIRSWKGRPGYSDAARASVAEHCEAARSAGREPLILQFSHPRLAAELPADAPIVCAWGGDRCMQEAAARWLAASGRGSRG